MECQFAIDPDKPHLARCTACGKALPHGGHAVERLHRKCSKPGKAIPSRGPAQQAKQATQQPDWWPRDEDGGLIPQAEIVADDMPCPHRGEVLRTANCEFCGMREVVYEQMACAKHGECSLVPRKRGLRDCLKCPERREPALVQIDLPPARPKRNGPLRVACLTPEMGAGGAERWHATLAKSMPAFGAIVTAIGIIRHGQKWDPICRELARSGVTLHGTRDVHWGWQPEPATPVNWLVNDETVIRQTIADADIIISWGIFDAGRLLQKAGWQGPHVIVAHGASDWTRSSLDLRDGTDFAAVSQAAAMSFPETVRARVQVIPNGIELDRVSPSRDRRIVRAEWGCSPDDILIGYMGRFSPEKNPIDVARACDHLRKQDERFRPVWIGSGLKTEVDQLQSKARELVGDRGVWVDPPAHVGDALAALDCLMMTSPREGGPLVVLEALAAGVPVVATPVGLVPDLIETGTSEQTTLIAVPVDASAEQLAQAVIDSLRANPGHGRQIVFEHYSAAKFGRQWAEWLNSIV